MNFNLDETVPPSQSSDAPELDQNHPALDRLPAGSAEKIGDYKVLGVLGSGGMGIVYKAFDFKFNRTVALKRLHFNVDPYALIRFRGEAETLGSLQHPNIVQVFDFGMHDGAPYLVMEIVSGGGLDRQLASKPQYPRKAAELVEVLARAMHVAHEHGIVHRDLKPGNILMTGDGTPKITDFGLAKRLQVNSGLTQSNAAMGTPSYMAPEQAAGKKDVGVPADVYALGAILYEMMTGRPPFIGASLQETLEHVQNLDPTPPSQLVPKLPRDLQSVCMMCLHKAPGRRYTSAQELADDLRNFLDGLPVKALPMSSFERLIRSVARRPQRAFSVGMGLLVVIMAIALGVNTYVRWYQDELAEKRKTLEYLRDMHALTVDLNSSFGRNRFEQILGERREKLKGPGASPEQQLMLARNYSRLADLRRDQGEVDRALESLNLAVELLKDEQKSREAAPETDAAIDDPDRALIDQVDRARIYQERGFLLSQTEAGSKQSVEDSQQALKLLDDYSSQGGKGTDNVEFVRVRADAIHDFAVATWRIASNSKGSHDNMLMAEAKFREAEDLIRGLVDESGDDSDRRNLARTLAALANLYVDLDRRQEADAVYWESHVIREELFEKAPRDYERKYQLARSWNNFGRYQTRQRLLGTALYFYCRSEERRTELNQRQPDNKDYVLELTGVLNRIAELELFEAEPEVEEELLPTTDSAEAQDLRRANEQKLRERLGEADQRLDKCFSLLNELFATLASDAHYDRETGTRAYAILGECRALQARAEMLRLDLSLRTAGEPPQANSDTKGNSAVLDVNEQGGDQYEKARTAARAAGDMFARIEARQDPTADELYQKAAASFLVMEVHRRSRASNSEKSNWEDEMLEVLRLSVNRGFRRLAPEEIDRDRAFRRVRENPKFKEIIQNLAKNQGPQAAPSSSQTAGK